MNIDAIKVNAIMALANWQKYNNPKNYDEIVYQAEKMALVLEDLIKAVK